MSAAKIDYQWAKATPVASLSLILMLFIIVSGSTGLLSPGSLADPRAFTELQQHALAPHVEKIRVERTFVATMAGSGNDHDGPDGLPAGPPDSGADDAVQALFVVPVCNGPGPCRAFVRPLPRAPPLA
ncbi:hypothetical protein [Marinobacter sp. HL-58]|uniref:hypothetical protein n=1 Tax=Marinobacter sp. HL-58 TaxID=1479237 RepID=UPI000489961F|nr:hypothetical protein [Marinobacter sp. HL-58]KPQ02417.1 MAG: hypothetical protein HLUCCO03_15195 [Marinobacter sp. HL-58]